VEILDCDIHPTTGRAYIVMELLQGENLGTCLRRVGSFKANPRWVAAMAGQIAGALAAAHGKGITHRDLKPDNIFLASIPDATAPITVKVLVLPMLIVFCGATGHAQSGSKAARPFYDKGVTEYTLGHFPEAIAQFEKAYEIDPAPILLFNIAQAHRHSGNTDCAVFFYRRYLEQAPRAATNRSDVEKRIKDLEQMSQRQPDRERGATSGGGQIPGGPAAPSASVAIFSPPADHRGVSAHPISVGTDVGVSFPSFAGRDVGRAALVAIRLFGTYAFSVGRGAVDVGAAVTFAPMHYEKSGASSGGAWSTFSGALARIGGSYPIALDGALHVIADAEAGVIWWGGLAQNNPFTNQGEGASGPVPMPTVRVGAGLRYEIGDQLFAYILPAYTFSKTTSDGLTLAITSVTRIDLPVGLGWKF
jgi:tetratricopeptide (TPR) repeat protein